MQKIINSPEDITPAFLQVVIMPNGEIICLGKKLGSFERLKESLWELSKKAVEA